MGTLAARWMSWHLWIDWEMEGDKSKCKKAFSCGCAEWMGVTAIIDVHLEVEIAISPWNIHRLPRNMAGNLTGWKIQRNTDLRGYFIGQDWLIFCCPRWLQTSTLVLFYIICSFLKRIICFTSEMYSCSEMSCVASSVLSDDLRFVQKGNWLAL